MPRIAVDAMGGDSAPASPVAGAVDALSLHSDLEVLLVGPEEQLKAELQPLTYDATRLELFEASEVIGMEESPVVALRRKRNSSISVLIALLKEGRCDGIFSAGNTGAVVAACSMGLGLLPGIRRPGIAVPMPRGKTPVVLTDVGANVACKPQHLLQYGIMACEFLSHVYSVEKPRVGLLNVGQEDEKGNALVKESRELFRASDLNYVGNVEGGDIFLGDCDVIVCDGFVGNIVLKTSEALSSWLIEGIVSEVGEALKKAEGSDADDAKIILADGLRQLGVRFDYAEYGGAPLLGTQGVCTIGHGRSNPRAVRNALGWTQRMIEEDVQRAIIDALARSSDTIPGS
ncbi:MAG TPA: phosphate acyltransferase PlsX [Planctomycetes bacterium]|nr:phosphate acyltransferase PlsX [Planctomycetota bacterium]HIN80383.1 phosphate acyltransferase PlsX [Planctomycetota bacterium]